MLITQLLRKHGFDFLLSSLPSSVPTNPARKAIDTKAFRNVLSSAILATDMSLHFAWILNLKEFGASISRGEGNTKLAKQEAEMDRITLCQSLIKCADISNPVSHLSSFARSHRLR
jgi:hypothetical protein